jgi:hypothetical protein
LEVGPTAQLVLDHGHKVRLAAATGSDEEDVMLFVSLHATGEPVDEALEEALALYEDPLE